MRRIFILFPFFLSILHSQVIDRSAWIGYESIKSIDLKKDIDILCSDSLEGRETTFPGQKKASQFIAGIFQKLGLRPAGDSSTYYQHFDVESIRYSQDSKIVIENRKLRKNFYCVSDFISKDIFDTTITGKAAFIGFTDSEIDSIDSANLSGKIVFMFIGKRIFADDTTKEALFNKFSSYRNLPNAAATFLIPDEDGAATFKYVQDSYIESGMDKGIFQIKSDKPLIHSPVIRFIISPALAETVLNTCGKSIRQIRQDAKQNQAFKPVYIDSVTITIEAKIIDEIKQTENVLGILPGNDSDLKSETVVFSAHYDHLGKDESGVIYHGADDNASGTAAVLELAQAFVKNPVKPKRSLLFLMMVGEEKGFLGSRYYVDNPVFPLQQTITDLNLDMVGRIDTIHEALKDTNYIYVIGSDRISSELDSLLKAANYESEKLRFDYKYDDRQDSENFYYRSDHYQFAKNNIPIVFFFDGINTDYHRPSDTADKIMYDRMTKICRMIYYLGWKLANFDRLLIKKIN